MATELDYMEYANHAAAQAAYVTDAGYSSDLCAGGTPIGGTLAWTDINLIFDNDLGDASRGHSNDGAGASGVSWIGYDFGAGNLHEIRRFGLSQHTGVNGITSVKVEYSDNGTDWTTVETVTVTKQYNPMLWYNVIASSLHRYWRLMANENVAADGWYVYEIEFLEIVLQCYSESTIKEQGTYSLKGVALITASLNDTLTRTVSPTIDLTDLTQIKFDIRASRTGSQIKIGIHDSGGTTTEHTANIASANTWQTETWDISGVSNANKDAIDSIIITIVNADAANTFYVDNMYEATTAGDNVIFFSCNF